MNPQGRGGRAESGWERKNQGQWQIHVVRIIGINKGIIEGAGKNKTEIFEKRGGRRAWKGGSQYNPLTSVIKWKQKESNRTLSTGEPRQRNERIRYGEAERQWLLLLYSSLRPARTTRMKCHWPDADELFVRIVPFFIYIYFFYIFLFLTPSSSLSFSFPVRLPSRLNEKRLYISYGRRSVRASARFCSVVVIGTRGTKERNQLL